MPALADSADLIAARAYLERFRESAAPDDLTAARNRLRRINPGRLGVRAVSLSLTHTAEQGMAFVILEGEG
ncbi:MAG: hypothetical protein AAB654_10665 [Acidobacteriota bacterium]